jgi:pimeloyl-ACP methyl ester carboxylesterase
MKQFIDYKNIKIAFDTQGKGEAIVLLHGFLENSNIWESLLPVLSKTHQVIAIDLLGHGETERIGYIHSMETMAASVNCVLEKLQVETAGFIGHSMGGYVALAFAELFPQKINQLVLLNSTTVADSEERKQNRDRAKVLVKQNKGAFISMAIKNLFTDKTRNLFRKEINYLIEEASQIPAEDIIASIEGLKTRKERTKILKNFQGKKLIITGKNDTVVPFAEILQISRNTNTEMNIFEDGHMSYIENKTELEAELLKFLH